jgi:hypothetical protein
LLILKVEPTLLLAISVLPVFLSLGTINEPQPDLFKDIEFPKD